MGMCVVDWSAVGSLAQAAAGFAGVAALVWATNKGAEKFGDWQKQKQTERQMAVAEELLTLAYRLDRAIRNVRNPVSDGWETSAAETKLREVFEDFDNKSNEEKHRLRIAQVVLTRLNDRKEDWDAIFAAMPAAQAYLGVEMKSVLDDFWKAVVRIRISALNYWDAPQADRNRKEADFWEGAHQISGTDDVVGGLASGAMARAEARLLPLLTSHLRND